jgi:hypothetical protein
MEGRRDIPCAFMRRGATVPQDCSSAVSIGQSLLIAVNLTGPMYLTKAVAPIMKAQGRGRIGWYLPTAITFANHEIFLHIAHFVKSGLG